MCQALFPATNKRIFKLPGRWPCVVFYSPKGVSGDHPDRVASGLPTISSQDILGNKSNVSIKVYAYHDGPLHAKPTVGSVFKNWWCQQNKRIIQPNFEGTSETKPQLLMSWTGDIPHNADGTKAIIRLAGVLMSHTLDYLYGSHNWTISNNPEEPYSNTKRRNGCAYCWFTNQHTNRANWTFA